MVIKNGQDKQLNIKKAKYNQARVYGAVVKIKPNKIMFFAFCGMFHIFDKIMGVSEKNKSPKERESIGIICPLVRVV